MFRIRNIAAGALAVALFAAPAVSGSETRRNDLCYIQCQYQCYAVYQGGGPAWEACYIACARTQCSAG